MRALNRSRCAIGECTGYCFVASSCSLARHRPGRMREGRKDRACQLLQTCNDPKWLRAREAAFPLFVSSCLRRPSFLPPSPPLPRKKTISNLHTYRNRKSNNPHFANGLCHAMLPLRAWSDLMPRDVLTDRVGPSIDVSETLLSKAVRQGFSVTWQVLAVMLG